MKRHLLLPILSLFLSHAAAAQVITTVAGGGPADGVPAKEVGIGYAPGLAVDADGNRYFSAPTLQVVFRVAPDGKLYRVAGTTSAGGFAGDGGPATEALLSSPQGVAVGANGIVYIADQGNHRIRKVDGNGTITTVAGTGSYGFGGDAGPATAALLASPFDVAVGTDGSLFIADQGNSRIRRVDPNGVITTFAGTGAPSFSGDGGPASAAQLQYPTGVAVDPNGNVYVSDYQNHRVRKIATNGTISTVAGSGIAGYSGDNGPATAASLSYPRDVALDANGNLYIADTNNYRVRRVSATGTITTVAGTGSCCSAPVDGTPATSAQIVTYSVASDSDGALLIGTNIGVRSVVSGLIATVAGNGGTTTFTGDGGPATTATLAYPRAVATDLDGNVYIGDNNNRRVRKVTPSGVITTIAGNGQCCYSGDDGPATEAAIGSVTGLAVDANGNVYLAEQQHRVRKVSAAGVISTVAGNGSCGFSGDGGIATNAMLCNVYDVAVDMAGNLYIADYSNSRIRKVTAATGVITTVAGNGSFGFAGNGVSATNTSVPQPRGVAIDAAGNLFVTSRYYSSTQYCGSWGYDYYYGYYYCNWYYYQYYYYNYVHKISPTGTLTNLVNGTTYGYFGDGGPSQNAGIYDPWDIGVDGSGNVYLADYANQRIRRIAANGIMSTVAGNGSYGFSGDGGSPTVARLAYPYGIAVTTDGTFYIADSYNHRVRRVSFNQPPHANAGADITVEATAATTAVSLDGSSSYDQDPGDILTFTWLDAAEHVVGTGAQLTLSLPLGTSTFTLRVTDSHGGTSTDAIAVTVADTTPPSIAIAAPSIGSYQLNQAAAANFTCSDTVSAVQSCVGTVASGQSIVTATAGSKTFTVTATDGAGNSASASVTYSVAKGVPQVSWATPATIVYGTALSAQQLNASASIPGTLSYAPAAGTLLDTGNGQALQVTFTPDDTDNYTSATASVTIDVGRATPTIVVGGGSFTYDAAAHPASVNVTGVGGMLLSGATVTYNGVAAEPVNAGIYTVVGSYPGSQNYEPVTGSSSITINKATASIALSGLMTTYSGTAKGATASTTPAGLTVVLSYKRDGAPVAAPVNAGTYAVEASVVDANYEGSASGVLTIDPAPASIVLSNLAQTYDGSPKQAVVNTVPSGLTTLAITYDGSPTLPTNAGSYAVTATLSNPNYVAAAGSGTLVIAKASQTIAFGSLSPKTYGDAPFEVSATASSGLPVSFSTSGSCTSNGTTVTLTAGGLCTVTASQAGSSNYLAAVPVQQSFSVAYTWSDVLQPVNRDGSSIFKLGSTVPLKFQLTGAAAGITTLPAKIYVAQISNGVLGTELEPTSTAAADTGNTFRYDPTAGQYIFNLSTKTLSQGAWQLRIDLADGISHVVVISLRR